MNNLLPDNELDSRWQTLRIEVKSEEEWDEVTETFQQGVYDILLLRHSLVSIDEWESKWHKAYFGSAKKTNEEAMDYIRCMTLNRDVDPIVYQHLTQADIQKISAYLEDPMTATTFREDKSKKRGRPETITAEIVYFWMLEYGIPFECRYWHINKLLTLVRVCNVKNSKPEKKSQKQLLQEHAAINARNRQLLHTRG